MQNQQQAIQNIQSHIVSHGHYYWYKLIITWYFRTRRNSAAIIAGYRRARCFGRSFGISWSEAARRNKAYGVISQLTHAVNQLARQLEIIIIMAYTTARWGNKPADIGEGERAAPQWPGHGAKLEVASLGEWIALTTRRGPYSNFTEHRYQASYGSELTCRIPATVSLLVRSSIRTPYTCRQAHTFVIDN